MNHRWAITGVGGALGAGLILVCTIGAGLAQEPIRRFAVDLWARPHHVAPTPDGAVWYTAQGQGALGRLDPETGEVETIPLGAGSKPRGLFTGPDGALWVTDSGLNAILRFDPQSREFETFAMPRRGLVNLHGATFDAEGKLWFTGQSGIYGRLDPATGEIELSKAPRGPGPTGITTTPAGEIYFTSYNGNYLARIDPATGDAVLIDPPEQQLPLVDESADDPAQPASLPAIGPTEPTPEEMLAIADDWPVGPVGVAADSQGRIWVTEKDAGSLGMYDPATESWQEWRLPLTGAEPYALWIDGNDQVWLSDLAGGYVWSFDLDTERFERRHRVGSLSRIYHIRGRPGEIWAADNTGGQILLMLVD